MSRTYRNKKITRLDDLFSSPSAHKQPAGSLWRPQPWVPGLDVPIQPTWAEGGNLCFVNKHLMGSWRRWLVDHIKGNPAERF